MSGFAVTPFLPPFIYKRAPLTPEQAARQRASEERNEAFALAERRRWREAHPMQALLADLAEERWHREYTAELRRLERKEREGR